MFKYFSKTVFSTLLMFPISCLFLTVSFQRKKMLIEQCLIRSQRHTLVINVTILHQSNLVLFEIDLSQTHVQLNKFSLPIFLLYISFVHGSGKQLLITWMVIIGLQGKIGQGWFCKSIQCRAGQDRACKCKAGHLLQSRRRDGQLKILQISCSYSIQSVNLLCHGTNEWCIFCRKYSRQFLK